MDTNPFAMSPNSPQQQSATPSYLQPQGATTSMPGNISNMVKAIMAGNAQHQMQQQRQGAVTGANPMTTTGGPSVGAPQSLAPPAPGMAPGMPSPPAPPPPVDPSAMTGGAGSMPPPMPPPMDPGGALPGMGTGMAGPMPGMGMPQDPVAQALMSPIPGAGMGSQFGG